METDERDLLDEFEKELCGFTDHTDTDYVEFFAPNEIEAHQLWFVEYLNKVSKLLCAKLPDPNNSTSYFKQQMIEFCPHYLDYKAKSLHAKQTGFDKFKGLVKCNTFFMLYRYQHMLYIISSIYEDPKKRQLMFTKLMQLVFERLCEWQESGTWTIVFAESEEEMEMHLRVDFERGWRFYEEVAKRSVFVGR